MWLRRLFGQGETPEDAPPAENQEPLQQAPTGTPARGPAESAAVPSATPPAPMQPGEEATAPADATGADATSAPVSPPGHAPQGLAAEPAARTPDLVPGADPPAHLRDEVAHTLETAGAEQTPAGDEIAGAAPGEDVSTPDAELSIPTFEVPELAVPSFAPAEETPLAEQQADAAPQEAPATAPAVASQPPAAVPAGEPTEPAPAVEATASATASEPPQATPEVAATAAPQSPDGVPEATTAPQETASGGQVEPATDEAPAAQAKAPAGETPAGETSSEPTADVAVPVASGPLEPGTVVAGRYTIKALAEGADPEADALVYTAVDERSYERCWSCGSTANNANTRFCQNCGAPIQGHQVTLVQTRVATEEPGELEQDGAYFHVQPERRKFGAEGMGLEIGAHSAEGPHHPNEDSYWYTTRSLCANSGRLSTAIAVFADGMGGYAPGSGLISSRIVASVGKSILAALDERVDMPGTLDETEAENIVRQAIATANAMVLDEIAHTGEMGATLVTVMIHGDTAYVANIGDSRAYYIDPHGRTTVITRDQSLVAEQVQMGHLAENDVYTAVGNNIILHAIGEEGVQDAADWYAQPLEPGSYLLVCSDGYWKTLRGAVMPEGMLRESDTLAEAARRMVDDALAQGSDDNTTLMLIAIS